MPTWTRIYKSAQNNHGITLSPLSVREIVKTIEGLWQENEQLKKDNAELEALTDAMGDLIDRMEEVDDSEDSEAESGEVDRPPTVSESPTD